MQYEHLVALARELSRSGFADTLDRQAGDALYTEMAFGERVASLLIAEKERRASNRLTRMLNEAKLPVRAAPEELINKEARGFKPAIMSELLKCSWIPHAWNILISGETGTGKSWIAACIATSNGVQYKLRPTTLETFFDAVAGVKKRLEGLVRNGSGQEEVKRKAEDMLTKFDDW